MYFLDTNTIIYAVKGEPFSVKKHFERVSKSMIYVPSIVQAELEYGARHSNNYEKTIALYDKFLSFFPIVDFGEKEAKVYGIIRDYLASKGEIIGANDLLIAACAVANDAILVTNNVREFERIKDLKIEDWTLSIRN